MKKVLSVILVTVTVISLLLCAGVSAAGAGRGDVNGDGKINNKDVAALFRFVSGAGNKIDESASDVNGDGKINNKDVAALFRLVNSDQPDDPDDPDAIKIGTREELLAFAGKVNGNAENFSGKTIKLTADIDLDPEDKKETNWVPLTTGMLKEAVIDGGGHTIKNMRMKPAQVSGSMGFIGIASSEITVKNITFDKAVLEGAPKHSGVVIGSLEAGGKTVELDNVTVKNSVVSGNIGEAGNLEGISFRMGILVGANIYSDFIYVHNCKVESSEVSGFHNISGLIGCTNDKQYKVENNSVKNCEIYYSASYSKTYKDPAVSRYFADFFYEVNNCWGESHTSADAKRGNTYSGKPFNLDATRSGVISSSDA